MATDPPARRDLVPAPPGTGDRGHGEACSLTSHTRDVLEGHLRHGQGLIHPPGSLAARIQHHGDAQTLDPVVPFSGVRPEKRIPNKVDIVHERAELLSRE